ncbi:Non-specific lipid-transfer protein [Linum grandiflorum]
MAASQKLVTLIIVVCALKVADGQGMTCGQVTTSMMPCLPYLMKGGPVPAPCCNGMRSLNKAAKTTIDRQKACECLKSEAGRIPDLKEGLAAALPDACGIHLPYKFTTKTNCNSVE